MAVQRVLLGTLIDTYRMSVAVMTRAAGGPSWTSMAAWGRLATFDRGVAVGSAWRRTPSCYRQRSCKRNSRQIRRQHAFESALPGKPLKGNAKRGAYLNFTR